MPCFNWMRPKRTQKRKPDPIPPPKPIDHVVLNAPLNSNNIARGLLHPEAIGGDGSGSSSSRGSSPNLQQTFQPPYDPPSYPSQLAALVNTSTSAYAVDPALQQNQLNSLHQSFSGSMHRKQSGTSVNLMHPANSQLQLLPIGATVNVNHPSVSSSLSSSAQIIFAYWILTFLILISIRTVLTFSSLIDFTLRFFRYSFSLLHIHRCSSSSVRARA